MNNHETEEPKKSLKTPVAISVFVILRFFLWMGGLDLFVRSEKQFFALFGCSLLAAISWRLLLESEE
jgi:hypothetical protein